ncbi:hypothetical protein FAZ95_07870 [Trinickia violacea]|uniref:Uncharacterized protein n=1 Tax=Trinickia violacea TaxID=2571746 RepID=A0A4P8IJW1_9BURK|nr:hypothetical protein [Trinickia violacea]QCP49102.1 hypothetical protein FAZ95_07870 [Trinickia violacea]
MISDDSDFFRCARSIGDVFGDAVALAPADGSPDNVTVFAWKDDASCPTLDELLLRAHVLEAVHPLTLQETAIRIDYGKRINWAERPFHGGQAW